MKMKIFVFLIMLTLIATFFLPLVNSNQIKNDTSALLTNMLGSEPRMTDNSGGTTFHGLFVGVPFAQEAQDLADELSKHAGWDKENMTVLKNESVTSENVENALEELKWNAESGDEVVIYFGVHGGDNLSSAKDGTRGRPPDNEPNGYDNHIYLYDWVSVTDDQLSDLIDGFEPCVTITVIIDACYSGTFSDGDDDLDHAKDGGDEEEEYDENHLCLMLSSEGKTPTRKEGETYTDKIIEGLKKQGDTTAADKNKDGVTTSKEMISYVNPKIVEKHTGDTDGDGLIDEDDIDYVEDGETGRVRFLYIDNDGDGLIDEDIHPPKPNHWFRNYFTVDDDGNADFSSIQSAINAANPYDKIIVSPGVYNEQIIISKEGLELVSTSIGFSTEEKTIIQWNQGSVILIQSPHTDLTGFSIQNCGTGEEDAAVDITSDYNQIGWNEIIDNGATGIYLHDSSNSNYIHHNVIKDNDGAGIFIWEESENNWIYHNDFINNLWYNVKDKEGGNVWNYLSKFGGNYWDDYTGTDTNNDGIGEEPYEIKGDSSTTGFDEYPWVEPNRWNKHPKIPTISGETNGNKGEEYDYEFEILEENFGPGSDPFEEHVYCSVDWGDGDTELIGPKKPGSIVQKSHSWDEEGTYTIQAKIIDSYGVESDWGSLEVSMPKTKINIIESFRLFDRLLERFPLFEFLFCK